MAIEIVDLPIKNAGSFHSLASVQSSGARYSRPIWKVGSDLHTVPWQMDERWVI